MARPQNRKRQHPDELSQSNPPAKKAKTTWENNFSPTFWDKLSKVWLTPRALRELDRRNNSHSLLPSVVPGETPTELTRFARHGGPDLNHLRGYPDPKKDMSSSAPSTARSRGTRSTARTSVSSKARKSSAYDDDFEQHLVDNYIYPEGYEHPASRATPEPGNSSQTRQDLLNSRASLSPLHFTESAFRDFKRKNKTKSEGSIMRNVIPIIAGDANIPNEGNITFTNLTSLTDESTVRAVPDYFDGTRISEIHSAVKRDLKELIIPTKHVNIPAVPNFFLEAKGPNGSAFIAEKQACYDGAYGARAMHALQNYQETEPMYDGNAYTYSSTYHAGTGTLQLYAHHVTAPTTSERQPEYHMTQLRSFGMTDSRETFVAGAAAFRNARDSAKRHRDSFIGAANTRATRSAAGIREAVAETDGASALYTQYEPANRTEYSAWQDADYALQQQIADGSDHVLQNDAEVAGTVPRYLYPEQDSPNASQESAALAFDDPSMSFTSSFTTTTTDPKRLRDSTTPPASSKRIHAFEGQSNLCTARGFTRSSKRAPVSTQSGSSHLHWVEPYMRRGKVCFKDADGKENKTELKEWVEQTVDGTRCYCRQSSGSEPAFWVMEMPKEAKKSHRRRP
ncbi:hypothetical protein MAJ_01981, partial [Metarhizium majus ARSEF 297]